MANIDTVPNMNVAIPKIDFHLVPVPVTSNPINKKIQTDIPLRIPKYSNGANPPIPCFKLTRSGSGMVYQLLGSAIFTM